MPLMALYSNRTNRTRLGPIRKVTKRTKPTLIKSTKRPHVAGLFRRFPERLFQRLFTQRRADEQLLPRPSAQGDGFPAVLRRHGDAHLDLAAGVADRTDHTGNYRADLGIGGQQPLEQTAHAVDDGVLHFELVLSGSQTHAPYNSENGSSNHAHPRRWH